MKEQNHSHIWPIILRIFIEWSHCVYLCYGILSVFSLYRPLGNTLCSFIRKRHSLVQNVGLHPWSGKTIGSIAL